MFTSLYCPPGHTLQQVYIFRMQSTYSEGSTRTTSPTWRRWLFSSGDQRMRARMRLKTAESTFRNDQLSARAAPLRVLPRVAPEPSMGAPFQSMTKLFMGMQGCPLELR